MAKKKGSDDAGNTRQRRYYDPGAKTNPKKKLSAEGTLPGPVLNSRNQRRQRARLPFIEQFELALKMGFQVPTKPAEAIGAESGWIAKWEREYAKL